MGARRNSDLGPFLDWQTLLPQILISKFLPLCLIATDMVCSELQLRQKIGNAFKERQSEY
jgi:hypothetical protein